MTIISLANAMYSGHLQRQQDDKGENKDRLDAARALLGVSPNNPLLKNQSSLSLFSSAALTSKLGDTQEPTGKRGRSNSAGLDALAFFASAEEVSMDTEQCSRSGTATTTSQISSSDDDSETMPPPPPRFVRRRRSVSNPEGMDKWGTALASSKLRLVLPTSILEEELAEAAAALKAKEEASTSAESDEEKDDSSDEEEEILDANEMLRRARSKLLEDLSQGNINGEKGILALPHSLEKYKEIYSKNGRVGIYTPSERAAIINRYQSKRTRRVWNKKIRYNCRKNLADRRMRVKGRFVKRSTEQQARAAASSKSSDNDDDSEKRVRFVSVDGLSGEEDSPPSKDEEMPDAEAERPHRRLRRYTFS